MEYIASQEDSVITDTISNMKLSVHRNASYLSEPKAKIRASGNLFLSNKETIPQNNGAIINTSHIIKQVMTSAT